jgi:hypothetical protein
MLRMSVLGLQASHLLLIRTNLGYGTVLTPACARQGCNPLVILLFISQTIKQHFFTTTAYTLLTHKSTATLIIRPPIFVN